MARVTVEDCVDKIPNRFELVLLAAQRARSLRGGAAISVERENDKDAVVALREIADETISPGDLREMLIHSIQTLVETDDPEPDAAPTFPPLSGLLARDSRATDTTVDTMTEEALLLGLERLAPTEAPVGGVSSDRSAPSEY